MIRIAIDGPGGAGKSSVARAIAKRLGIIYVDTGALYRNIGFYMLRVGINPKDAEAVTEALGRFTLELKFIDGEQVILLNGENVGDAIRTSEVAMAASDVSAIPAVREYLLEIQRDTAKTNSVVMDGRDIGTVILPDAEVKIFLTASAKARAERRYKELLAKGASVTLQQVYAEMVERDSNDSNREIAPCVQAKDAILVDNSNLSAEETVTKIINIIKKKSGKRGNFYSRAKAIVAPLFRFFMRVSVKGVENVPTEGGVLLCANHIAAVDVISIGAVCPRQLTCIAKKELFSVPILGRIVKALGAVKLDRGGGDVGAIKASVAAVTDGKVVTIFPQGHRYPGVNPATTPIRHGAGLIAYHSKCDVVPVCINLKKGKYGFLRKTEVIFGKPIKYSELEFTNGGRDEYERATEKIFAEVVGLGDQLAALPAYLPAPKEEKAGK